MPLCPSCNEDNPAPFRLCGYCGTPLAARAPAPPPREIRRTVTLVFSDLVGFTALGERLDPEALHEVKDCYFAAMSAEITRHGGKIEKYIGDAILAVFGLPRPYEDDALRAVRAASGMQAALVQLNRELKTRWGVALAQRIGVNTGEVVANDDPAATQQLATGDAVNVAARLEQAAPAGQIYLGDVAWRLVRDAVEVQPVAPLEVKGKSEPIAAYRLVSARGLDGNARRHDAPLVGREQEIAAVELALREATQTRSVRLVTVLGDAGIGKSRLAAELVARMGAGARVLRGRCLPYGDGITFWPLRQMASEAADIRFDDAPYTARARLAARVGDDEVAERLAAAAGLSGAAFPLHELYWAARKFLETIAADGPLVVLVDDIHWAEPAFLDLLEHVLDTSEGAPILLLATARHDLLEERPQWAERPAALRIALRPLTDEAAAHIARNLLGASELSDAVAARIVDAAEGNPLYVEQILSMLVDNGVLRLHEGRWTHAGGDAVIAIPPTIKALLEARLGQLGREERAAIEPASVIGLEFPAPAVASLVTESIRPQLDHHLQTLTRKQFVVAAGETGAEPIYRFHHHLVRDTVYGGLLKRARATLHVDFVRWSDQVNAERGRALEYQEILGYHLEQAYRYLGELGPLGEEGRAIGRDAAARLAAAGRRAFSRADMHAAANLFRRAVALLGEQDPARLPLLPELGEVLLELGEFGDAKALADQALASTDPPAGVRVKASAQLVRMLVRLHSGEPGNWGEATLQITTETIPALEREGADAELAKAWRLVALVHQVAGRLGQAWDAIAKVIAHARRAGDERMVTRSALGLSFSALYGPTPVADAIAQCEALIGDGLSDRQVEGLILCKIAQLRAMNGEFGTARSLYQRGRSMLRDLGQGVHVASSSLDLAVVELLAGDPAAAEREVRIDYDTLAAMGETYFLSTMAALLARAVREQGRDAEALELTRTAESAAADDDVDAQVLWRSTRAPILARAGAHAEAEAMARAALDFARQTEVPILQADACFELATVLRLAGHVEDARRAFSDAGAAYRAKGDVVSCARVDDALAALPESERAIAAADALVVIATAPAGG